MEFPTKSGQLVKIIRVVHTRPGIGTRASSAVVVDCKTLRCIRKCLPWPPLAFDSLRDEPIPFSMRHHFPPVCLRVVCWFECFLGRGVVSAAGGVLRPR